MTMIKLAIVLVMVDGDTDKILCRVATTIQFHFIARWESHQSNTFSISEEMEGVFVKNKNKTEELSWDVT